MGEKSHSPQIQGAVFVGLIAALLRFAQTGSIRRLRNTKHSFLQKSCIFLQISTNFCKKVVDFDPPLRHAVF